MSDSHKQYYTVKETSEILGKHDSTIRRYCENGLLEGAGKSGLTKTSEWRIPVKTVEAALETIIVD